MTAMQTDVLDRLITAVSSPERFLDESRFSRRILIVSYGEEDSGACAGRKTRNGARIVSQPQAFGLQRNGRGFPRP
jgi:hypothetical protein